MKGMPSLRTGSTLLALVSLASAPITAEGAETRSPLIPHQVTGLVIKENDPLLKSFTLRWNPNPTSEKVDSYAIYLLNPFFPDNGADLITITKKTSATLKTWSRPRESGQQPKGTISLISDAGLLMTVVAHNNYGWGLVPIHAHTPDRSKNPVVPKSLNSKYEPKITYSGWDCTKELAAYYSQPC